MDILREILDNSHNVLQLPILKMGSSPVTLWTILQLA
ncbi:MAG TPA: mechanosensitive ion channel protein MscS, partial [Geobacter sp.]|nr:mechanosensitive ion channel protein MscS [Geobacter sp.]